MVAALKKKFENVTDSRACSDKRESRTNDTSKVNALFIVCISLQKIIVKFSCISFEIHTLDVKERIYSPKLHYSAQVRNIMPTKSITRS